MEWLFNFMTVPSNGLTILCIALSIAVGLILSKIKIAGFSIGITWILFVGILMSAFGVHFDMQTIGIVKDFGLILFIFAVGFQVGPTFFSSFKNGGLKLNALAIAIVFLGVVVTMVISLICNVPMEVMSGVYSGAISSTPGMSAAQQAVGALGHDTADVIANGYAVTYPIGVLGPIVTCILIRRFCKIRIDIEECETLNYTDDLREESVLSKPTSSKLLIVFVGIMVGVFIGSVPIPLGLDCPVKLGYAGGPLIVAILLGHFGVRKGWVTTTFVNGEGITMIREIGIAIFLACVGLSAGGSFVSTIVNGGYMWILYGLFITMIPVVSVGFFARRKMNVNYFTLIGLAGGATTNTPVLAFAKCESDKDDNHLSSVSYATVYPLTVFLRIVTAQLMVILAV